MPIDPNIALGLRAPQIESPMVHAARAAELSRANQQNMLGGMQMMELARANQQKNAMRDILSKAPEGAPPSEINRLIEKAYIGAGDISGLVAHRKTLAEAEAAQANVGKAKAQTKQAEAGTAASEFELSKKKIDYAWESVANSPTPQAYRKNIEDSVTKNLITREQADQGLAELRRAEDMDMLRGGDTNFKQLRMSSLEKLLSAKDQLARTEPKYVFEDIGGKKIRVQTNPNAPDFDPKLLELVKTPTIGEAETRRSNLEREKIDRSKLGIEGAKLKLQQQEAAQKADPAFQQAMAGAKARGEAIAKGDVAAVQALPRILDRANRSINLIDEMVGKQEVRDKNGKIIQAATAPHPGFNSAVGFGLGERFVPGTSASDFQSRFEEIKGGAFLEAFESLKGAGSISEKEGEKATTAITRMSLAQSEKEFVAAARDLQDVVRKATVNAQNRASQAGAMPNVDALVDKYKTK
jgi:hypothetical protein